MCLGRGCVFWLARNSGMSQHHWLLPGCQLKPHSVCQVSRQWPTNPRLHSGVLQITVCRLVHLWCHCCRHQVDAFESAQFYRHWMCLFAVNLSENCNFTQKKAVCDICVLLCKVTHNPSAAQDAFFFFNLWGLFAFGQKLPFLPSFSAENSGGTIPGRQMEADKCSGSFIYLSCIYSVIANDHIFNGCSWTCGESLRCNIRHQPWLKLDFIIMCFDSKRAVRIHPCWISMYRCDTALTLRGLGLFLVLHHLAFQLPVTVVAGVILSCNLEYCCHSVTSQAAYSTLSPQWGLLLMFVLYWNIEFLGEHAVAPLHPPTPHSPLWAQQHGTVG